ncbi:YdcF family protein [Dyella marensis]|uniref:Protein SanA, affects membrane permeability for vancomycin n=1 Tax=Dyella marensis TaxID=500610 RepID=A0A1I2HBN4_9GAMM|nr:MULTISPECIES: YdcF family protein [Dyella]SFF26377.1 protein SanA, affects membrane permeability for vancomycin [Dyella marensis]
MDMRLSAARRTHPTFRLTLRLGALGLLLWLVAALAVAFAGLATQPIAPADLALVLGNTVGPGNRPLPRLRIRLEAALALYRRGGCRMLMVSGGVEDDGRDEAAGMKQWLVEHGVPAEAIVEDRHGDNTRASARNARAWLDAHGQRSVVVVSQYFHLPRARLAIRQEGLVDAGGDYTQRLFVWDVYSSMREVLGYLAYGARLA